MRWLQPQACSEAEQGQCRLQSRMIICLHSSCSQGMPSLTESSHGFRGDQTCRCFRSINSDCSNTLTQTFACTGRCYNNNVQRFPLPTNLNLGCGLLQLVAAVHKAKNDGRIPKFVGWLTLQDLRCLLSPPVTLLLEHTLFQSSDRIWRIPAINITAQGRCEAAMSNACLCHRVRMVQNVLYCNPGHVDGQGAFLCLPPIAGPAFHEGTTKECTLGGKMCLNPKGLKQSKTISSA